jgi:lipopolysaccharide assembly protein A
VARSDPAQARVKRSRRELARTSVLVGLAVLVTLFAVLNVKQVEVNWIFGKSETPLIIVIVASLLVGVLFTHFAELRNRRKS